jgi:hypothetical protein
MLLSKFSINIEFDKRIDNKEEVIDHRDKLIEDIKTEKRNKIHLYNIRKTMISS